MVDCLLVDINPKLIKNVDYAKFFVAKFYEKCEIYDGVAPGRKSSGGVLRAEECLRLDGICLLVRALFGCSRIDHL